MDIGDRVRVWDDDRHCWRYGEVSWITNDEVEVIIPDGDHPWYEDVLTVPNSHEFIEKR